MNCYVLPNNKTHGFGRLRRECAATEKYFIFKRAVHSHKGSALGCLFALDTMVMASTQNVFLKLANSVFGKQHVTILKKLPYCCH